ncbi:MAG: metallophosphoesterase family protein [Opitutales bacterium]|nr:metallophosphoesterase family protein [Opitutales bacterium]
MVGIRKVIHSPFIYFISTVCAFLAVGVTSASGQTNLVINSDFESSEIGETPVGWTTNPSARPDIFVTALDDETGQKVGLLRNKEQVWNNARQRLNLPSGKVYQVSARFRSTEDNETIILSVTAPSSRTMVHVSDVFNIDEGWKMVSAPLVTQENGQHQLTIRSQGLSDFYVDDVVIMDTGEDVAGVGIDLLLPDAIGIPDEVQLRARVINQGGNQYGTEDEQVRWTLEDNAPDGLSICYETGLLLVESGVSPGTEVKIAATLESNDQIQQRAKVRLKDAADLTIPRQVILTWQNKPQTSKTITWRTDKAIEEPTVFFYPEEENEDSDYSSATGASVEFDSLATDPVLDSFGCWINTVELTGLNPDTLYRVVIPHPTHPQEIIFRTVLNNPSSIVFTAIADTHRLSLSPSSQQRQLLSSVAAEGPDFTLLVGDLWYADAQNLVDTPVDQFVDAFLDKLESTMIAPDGRRITIVPAEGNHDGNDDGAPFFYSRFPLPEQKKYYVMNYGPNLTIITLNSGHSAAISGEQTEWLEEVLEANQDSRWIVVQFHVSPYPSNRDPNGFDERQIRAHWVPLFEGYGVDLVINGHDHLHSRTYPIRNETIDYENGVTYIGNGFGTRAANLDRWFIKESASVNSFWKVTVSFGEDGQSSLLAEPIFPLDPSHVEPPVLLQKDAMGKRIHCVPPFSDSFQRDTP